MDILISKEYLDKIKGFSAIRPDEYFVYIPEVYRSFPVDLQAKFTLRPVSGEDAASSSSNLYGILSREFV